MVTFLIMQLHFFSSYNHTLYRQYLALKASTFGQPRHSQELVLPLESQVAEPDEADKHSLFLGCITNDGSMAGMIRGTELCRAFPHREYFSAQLDAAEMRYLEKKGFTMNALGVRKKFRGHDRGHDVEHKGVVYRSVSLALISCMSERFFENNYDICVITAIQGISARQCREVGFQQLGCSFAPDCRDRKLINLFKINPSIAGVALYECLRSFQN